MEENSRKGSNLAASHGSLQTREIASQFLEASRNGAMAECSTKGSIKVQISLQSHNLPNMGDTSQFRETSRIGAMGERSGKGSNLDASHKSLRTWEIVRQFLETSRSGNSGVMEDSYRKGSISSQSHTP